MRLSCTRTALALAAASLLLASCGGGESSTATAASIGIREFAARVQATPATELRRSALNVASLPPTERPEAVVVDAKALFDWAEFIYPTLFPKGPQNVPFAYLGVNYTIRAYPNGNYLGLTDTGQIYGLGPFNGNQLTTYGRLSDYAARIQADECKVYPSNCVNNPPVGQINECTMTASAALTIGLRLITRYETVVSGTTSTTDTDSLVDQNTTFEGQSVVRSSSTSTTTTAVSGQNITSTGNVKSYDQVGTGGMIRRIGNEAVATSGGFIVMGIPLGGVTTNSRTVFNPADSNVEFTLTAGQSLSKTTTQTVTSSSSIDPTPRVDSSSFTATHTFERRESIVVRGKNYDTCRYRQNESNGAVTTQWVIVGKGVPARIEGVSGGSTSLSELVSGSINGAPL